MLNFGNIIQSIQGIDTWIQNTVQNIGNIFADINFSVLYSWAPNDIQAVVAAIISVMIVLALIGLLKKMILFFG